MANLRQIERSGTDSIEDGRPLMYGNIAGVSENFHIEDRVRGHIVATGQIGADGRVIWDETEDIVQDELPGLAEQIQQDHASGFSGRAVATPP